MEEETKSDVEQLQVEKAKLAEQITSVEEEAKIINRSNARTRGLMIKELRRAEGAEAQLAAMPKRDDIVEAFSKSDEF